ncbi:MAG: aldo/keto reductase [Rhizobiaceae bacterium]|nr:aldo/keto reductase [Rhizobiaceae bacterium]
MKQNELGRTGIMVSELCLGSMTWGTQNSEAEGHEQIDYALDNGINFIDTAEMYPTTPLSAETQGDTERIIGTWVAKNKARRGDVVIATKVSGSGFKHVRNGAPISPATIDAALNDSLTSLQTDYVDLYQLHWPNRGSYHFRQQWTFDPTGQDTQQTLDNMLEVLEALDGHVKAGKIRAVGLSNESAWGSAQWLRLSEQHGLPRMATIQNEYSLLCRIYDLDLAELSHHEDLGLLSFSPLACGLLTGKYAECTGDERPKGSRADVSVANLGGRWNETTHAAVSAYQAIAEKHGLDFAQMSLAWCLTRPFMASVIFGATSMEQLSNSIEAAELKLSDEVMSDILAVYRQYPAPY